MTEKIRVGIIGCGWIAPMHVKNLLSTPEVQLAGFCSSRGESALRLKNEFVGKTDEKMVFTDYKEMIEECKLDAVEILTPNTYHFPQAMYALQKGLHVLLEKPITTQVSQARELIETADSRGKVLLVYYQRHYLPPYVYAKRIIEKGELGEIKLISITEVQEWVEGSKGTWFIDPEQSGGGLLIDSGSHYVDLMLWLTDLRPEEVFAFVDQQGLGVDISSSLSVKFKGGAVAGMCCGNAPGWYGNIYIGGTKGSLIFREFEPDGWRSVRVYRQLSGGDLSEIYQLPGPSNPDANFIKAILGKEENLSPGICGLRVIELTCAAYESAKEGRKVVLEG